MSAESPQPVHRDAETIRRRLLVFAGLTQLPFLVYLAVRGTADWSDARAAWEQRAAGAARVARERIEDSLARLRLLLDALAPAVSIDPAAIEANDAVLRDVAESRPEEFTNLSVRTPAGKCLGAARLPAGGRAALEALAPPPVAVSQPHRCAVTGLPVVTLTRPLRGADGSFAGFLCVSVGTDRLRGRLGVEGLPGDSSVTLVDERGATLARSGPASDGPAEGTVAAVRDAPWRIEVRIPPFPDPATTSRVVMRLASAAASILLALVVAWLIAERLGAPIRQLAHDAGRLAGGDLAHRSAVAAGGEIGVLADAFNRMAAEIETHEEALRENEERSRLLILGLRDAAAFLVDDEGRVMGWNEGNERLFGFREGEVLGQPLARFCSPEDVERDLPQSILGAARTAGRYEGEGWRVRRDGSQFRGILTVTPLRSSSGAPRGFACVVRDVTQQRRIEDQLRQSQKMEAMGRLAGGVAHDFNNLLTAIQGYADLAQLGLKTSDARYGHIEEIRKAADRAASLTRQLLAFGRRQVLETRVLDLNALVRHLEGMLRRLLGEPIRLVTTLEKAILLIKADPGQLEQVILNLALNARDAMPRGGTLTLETKEVEGDGGRIALLTVSDTGIGMASETLSHVFEPFFTTKGQSGLGLSTAYGIVSQSGGQITADSTPGQGTVFRVYLPRVEAEAGTQAPSAPAPSRHTETILFVEDEDAVRRLAHMILAQQGYTVLQASDGPEALEIAKRIEGPLHLLVTDAVLPRMSGTELARDLSAVRPEMKVLYVSGYSEESIVKRGVVTAVAAYLQKPFSPEMLKRAVRAVLDSPNGRAAA